MLMSENTAIGLLCFEKNESQLTTSLQVACTASAVSAQSCTLQKIPPLRRMHPSKAVLQLQSEGMPRRHRMFQYEKLLHYLQSGHLESGVDCLTVSQARQIRAFQPEDAPFCNGQLLFRNLVSTNLDARYQLLCPPSSALIRWRPVLAS